MKSLIKVFVVLAVVMSSQLSFGQSTTDEDLKAHYRKMYQLSLKYNDMAVVRNTIYNMLAIEPQNDSILYNLALIYFEAKQYYSTASVCLDIIKINPQNAGAVEMLAISYENLGLRDKSLVTYEKLYLQNNNINHLYKMAFLQYDLKKYEEAKTNVEILLSRKEIDEEKLLFSFDNKTSKEFAMRVPVLNLKGMIYRELGDIEQARSSFQAALDLASDFEVATENLNALN